MPKRMSAHFHAFIQRTLLPLARALRSFGPPSPPAWPPLALEAAFSGGCGAPSPASRWLPRLLGGAPRLGGAREWGAAGALLGPLLRRGGEGEGGGCAGLEDAVWLAVPKRKTSYSKKRQRQMSPHYARKDVTHFYPCPKCDKGLLKLRHHICPCDQVTLNVSGVKQVRKGRGPPTRKRAQAQPPPPPARARHSLPCMRAPRPATLHPAPPSRRPPPPPPHRAPFASRLRTAHRARKRYAKGRVRRPPPADDRIGLDWGQNINSFFLR